ncbi:MAG TPA: TonB-dependent receptor [bacterium]|nr:TonB-dependent receptor [bacterium]
MVRIISSLIILASLLGIGLNPLYAAANGRIVGTVTDASTGAPLPGANLFLDGTAIGAVSDLKGAYQIQRIPSGSFILKIRFVGYKGKEVPVTIAEDETKNINIKLEYDVLKGETVTITAQAEGQAAAINQQLRSNTITNVVSAERIMELPDANAAESVGRLPGVSILRSGGEGNRVVIRGLAPTYNAITIGGEKIPATDLDDRSVDLNMISPEILAGIEVTKALTPDRDADAFGGTVNFQLADAPSGGFRSNFRFQEGYNNQRDELGQYKASMTLSNRYWGEKFGLMITGNLERAQRGSDQFNAEYSVEREKRPGEEYAPISVTDVDLIYTDEIRKRSGFSVLMDYRLPNGKIMLSNFMSRLDRNENIYTNRFSEDDNMHQLYFRNRIRQIDVLTNTLTGEHKFSLGTMDWRLSRTASMTRHPYHNYIRFRELSAFDRSNLPEFFGPDQLIDAAYNNLNNTFMYEGILYTEKAFERDQSAQLNFQWPFTLARFLAGKVKMGGKYVNKAKDRDRGSAIDRLDTDAEEFAWHHTRYGQPGFVYQLYQSQYPSISNYLDSQFQAKNFLGGKYDFGVRLDGDELNHLFKTYLADSSYVFSSLADADDYETTEKVGAGYIMSEINIGRFLMFLPGVRYEHTKALMTGRKANVPDDNDETDLQHPLVSDTTAAATYARWFPMFHLRIKPTSFFDIRMAYTRTLSRPRLDWMMPKKKVNGSSKTVTYGRPDLQPQIATNYDLFVSLYSNALGLFTLGGFYKEIDDLIFEREGHKILNYQKEGYPKELQGYWVVQSENNPFRTKVKGWEVEWQTNFHWLPSPLDGFVLNANYSHIWSETYFPRSFVRQEKIPVFPFVKTSVIDTFRVSQMPDQANDIANVAVGYDKGPFSARLSMLFQGRTLSSIGERPELDGFTADLLRMDLSVKFRLTNHLGLFFNWNNIMDEPDESFQQITRYPTAQEYYGWTSDVGIGYTF